jgi:hypothetical protein
MTLHDPLARLFKRHPVVDLDELFAALATRSRMTVFRRLSTRGYLTSYSHAGRYYTLSDIPRFDADGLWQHAGVLFSRDGTLKETVARLVAQSEAGLLHREVAARVRLRAHNTLADLVARARVGREPFEGEYLYVSANAGRAARQMQRRTQMGHAPVASAHPPGPAVVIEILVEVIHASAVTVEVQTIAARLVARGIHVSAADVEGVLQRLGVGKKTARSRSRPSRR